MTRLARLTAKNFLKIANFDEELSPLTLICAENEKGKSSLSDAISFVYTGDPGRVQTKKNYHELLHRGASGGSVTVVEDTGVVIERDIVTGRVRGSEPQYPAALPFVLKAGKFGKLEAGARRTFLFSLMGLKEGPDEIAKRLKARGIDQALIDRILPYLAGGFAPALSEAESHRAKSKAAWEEVTGDRYGSKKAEAWVADAPAFDPTELQQAAEDTEGWQAEIERLNRLVGRLNEVRKARGRIPELREQAKGYAKAAEDENLHQAELDRLKVALAALPVPGAAKLPEAEPEGLFTEDDRVPIDVPARQQAPAAQAGASSQAGRGPSAGGRSDPNTAPLSCPHCDTKLTLFNGRLIPTGMQNNG